MRYSRDMGRGQQTASDKFSDVFGDRRGKTSADAKACLKRAREAAQRVEIGVLGPGLDLLRETHGNAALDEAYGVLRGALASYLAREKRAAYKKTIWQAWQVLGIVHWQAEDGYSETEHVEKARLDLHGELVRLMPLAIDEAAADVRPIKESIRSASNDALRRALELGAAKSMKRRGLWAACTNSQGSADSPGKGHVRHLTGREADELEPLLQSENYLAIVRAVTQPLWARKSLSEKGLTNEGRRRGDFSQAWQAELVKVAGVPKRKSATKLKLRRVGPGNYESEDGYYCLQQAHAMDESDPDRSWYLNENGDVGVIHGPFDRKQEAVEHLNKLSKL